MVKKCWHALGTCFTSRLIEPGEEMDEELTEEMGEERVGPLAKLLAGQLARRQSLADFARAKFQTRLMTFDPFSDSSKLIL